MFIFDSLPFATGKGAASAEKKSDESDMTTQQQGLCLFSAPNILQNFTVSADPSLIYLYAQDGSDTAARPDAASMDVDESAFDFQRAFSFIKKPEDRQAYALLMQKDKVTYHPISHKVVLKLHRPSKQALASSRGKSIPPVITVRRRQESPEEIEKRQEAIQQLEGLVHCSL